MRWSHLSVDPATGLQMPVNVGGGIDGVRTFASVCPAKNAFLAMSGRCGVCGYLLELDNSWFVAWSTDPELLADGFKPGPDGSWKLTTTSAANASARMAGEGIMHSECVDKSRVSCPFLKSMPGMYRTVSDTDPVNRQALVIQALGVTLAPAKAQPDAAVPFAIFDRNLPWIALAGWQAGVPSDVDPNDSIPARLVSLTEIEITGLLSAVFGHAQESVGRNDPCQCGSGRKSKQCHRNQLAPEWMMSPFSQRLAGVVDDSLRGFPILWLAEPPEDAPQPYLFPEPFSLR